MLLGDILPLLSESENIFVIVDGRIVASYDGKNSIPIDLNNSLEVVEGGIYSSPVNGSSIAINCRKI